jgi:hypothetical protein
MQQYVKGGKSIHDLKLNSSHPPVLQDFDVFRFNHYNHNRKGHEWLLENCKWLDDSWHPVKYEDVFVERCELLRNYWRDLVVRRRQPLRDTRQLELPF